MSEGSAPKKTYEGGCQCGSFQFTVDLADITSVYACNCSFCVKAGALWSSAELKESDLKVTKDGRLDDYEFAPKNNIFKFCPTCGSLPYAVAKKDRGLALNLRSVKGINLWELKKLEYDMKKAPPHYVEPRYPGPDPEAGPGEKVFHGACHCGAVTLVFNSKPVSEMDTLECNCSQCWMNGLIIGRVREKNIHWHGEENLTSYWFNMKIIETLFCKHCSCHVSYRVDSDRVKTSDAIPDERKAMATMMSEFRNVNMLIVEEVDTDAITPRKLNMSGNADYDKYTNPDLNKEWMKKYMSGSA